MRFLAALFIFCVSLTAQADTVQKMEGTFKDTVTIGPLIK